MTFHTYCTRVISLENLFLSLSLHCFCATHRSEQILTLIFKGREMRKRIWCNTMHIFLPCWVKKQLRQVVFLFSSEILGLQYVPLTALTINIDGAVLYHPCKNDKEAPLKPCQLGQFAVSFRKCVNGLWGSHFSFIGYGAGFVGSSLVL